MRIHSSVHLARVFGVAYVEWTSRNVNSQSRTNYINVDFFEAPAFLSFKRCLFAFPDIFEHVTSLIKNIRDHVSTAARPATRGTACAVVMLLLEYSASLSPLRPPIQELR